MLSQAELEDLTYLGDGRHHVISVYLNVDPDYYPHGEYRLKVRNLLQEKLEELPVRQQRILQQDVTAILHFVDKGRPFGGPSLAVFSSAAQNLWRTFELTTPVRDEVAIQPELYLTPLAPAANGWEHYVIALVDRRAARLYAVSHGEITERHKVFSPDVPGQHKKGGWYALAEARLRGHIEQHVTWHLQRVAAELEDLLQRVPSRGVVLGGPRDTVLRLRHQLPARVARQVVGVLSVDIDETEPAVLSLAGAVVREAAHAEQEALVDRLVDTALSAGSAVVGVDDVAASVHQGRVRMLVLDADFRMDGYRCGHCGVPFSSELERCPYCGSGIEQVQHLDDLMLREALGYGGQIAVVREMSRLKEVGQVGAFLRY